MTQQAELVHHMKTAKQVAAADLQSTQYRQTKARYKSFWEKAENFGEMQKAVTDGRHDQLSPSEMLTPLHQKITRAVNNSGASSSPVSAGHRRSLA